MVLEVKPCMKILTIASHVVHGNVGNKASTFPLQLLGHDVDSINTCQLSNHTGYSKWGGDRLSAIQFQDLIEGLEFNNLIDYSCIVVGYVGVLELLEKIVQVICDLKLKSNALKIGI